MSIICIDDFLSDPHKIRNYAISLKNFYETTPKNQNNKYIYGWRGFRCGQIDAYVLYKDKILERIAEILKINPTQYIPKTNFHYTLAETKNTCDFSTYHTDSSVYAGLIYLTPNPPKNSGTSFIIEGKNIDIENKFNRMICYPSNIYHKLTDCFGSNIYNSRLTLIFFIYKNEN